MMYVDWDNKKAYNITNNNEYEKFLYDASMRFDSVMNLDDMIDFFLSEHFDNEIDFICEELNLSPLNWRNEVLKTEAWRYYYNDMVLEFINDHYEKLK